MKPIWVYFKKCLNVIESLEDTPVLPTIANLPVLLRAGTHIPIVSNSSSLSSSAFYVLTFLECGHQSDGRGCRISEKSIKMSKNVTLFKKNSKILE